MYINVCVHVCVMCSECKLFVRPAREGELVTMKTSLGMHIHDEAQIVHQVMPLLILDLHDVWDGHVHAFIS